MLAASHVADTLFGATTGLWETYDRMLSSYGIPTRIQLQSTGLSEDAFVARCLPYVMKDKKRKGMQVRFILSKELGSALLWDQVPLPTIESAIRRLCS